MAQESNPFFVQPMGDITQGLQGLGSAIGGAYQMSQARSEAERLQDLQMQAAQIYQSGDMEALRQFRLQNPELGSALAEEIGFRSEETKTNYTNSLMRALTEPESIPQIVAARQAYLKAQGQTPEETGLTDSAMEQYAADPEGFMESLELDLMLLDPDKYEQYKSFTAEPEVDLTTDIQNFEYYSELYKSNPDMADKFAVQVGITPADNYESLMAELEMMKLRQEVTAGEVEAVEKVEAKEAAETAKQTAMETSKVQLDRTLSQIDDIVTATKEAPLATGLPGFVLGGIKGTEAYGIRGDVELIKSKLALDMIKEMKQQSSTGATGFGAMSEKELALIQSAVDRLDPDMDRERFLQAMDEVKGHYARWKEYNDKALAEEAAMGLSGTDQKDTGKSKEDILSNLGF